MARKGFGCERKNCSSSTGIHNGITFGTGCLDDYGFWQFPCDQCEQHWIKLFGSIYSITPKWKSYGVTTV